MEISSVPLAEFYKYYSENVRNRRFKWMVTLVARSADAEAIYDNLKDMWLSLNSITGEHFLFVFSGNETPSIGFPKPADPSKNDPPAPYLPYNWRTDKERYLSRVRDNQTDAINSLKKLFGLTEDDIPCLVFTSLLTNNQYVVPVDPNADDLYGYFRNLLRSIEPSLRDLDYVEQNLHHMAEEVQDMLHIRLFPREQHIIDNAKHLVEERHNIIQHIEHLIQNSVVSKRNISSPVSFAHPLGRLEYLHIIANYLSQITARLDMVNPNNLMDFNQSLEQTYCGLLNRIFGWQLTNLNRVQMNIPGIDLACETGKICVQISSDARPDKIRKTLSAFFENEYDKKYNELYIVFIRKYTSGVKDFDNCLKQPFAFTYNEHVFDTARLYSQLSSIDNVRKLAEIADYLRDELGKFPC